MRALRDTVKMAFDNAGLGEPVPIREPVTPTVKPIVIEVSIINALKYCQIVVIV